MRVHSLSVLSFCLIVFLASGSSSQFLQDKSALALNCNLTWTREAREILAEEFHDVVYEHGYSIPTSCPFHYDNDIFKKFDTKSTIRRGLQVFNKCTMCPKVFETQHYLEKHFMNKHIDNLEPRGVCLGHYCDILGCDSWYEKQAREGCNDMALSQRATVCKNIMSACFPMGSSPIAGELLQLFTEQFCNKLNCADQFALNRGAKRKSKGSKTLYTVLVIMLLVCVAFFYFFVVYLKKEEIFGSSSRLRTRSRKGLFKSIWDYIRKKPKMKAY
eukprot:TRINITY_DN8426_c0_g1_i1.p1 TRINITY_DN8426_c0_g1~~TRINITY_DN8426_c0_g1_i1.p1  ORF type:complete len:273 (-),score=10.52 TRINITY_DN8426_c0_g1_i1:5-823(-)